VTDDSGTATRLRVAGRELVGERALPLDRIVACEGTPRLVLVPCGGPFLPGRSRFRDTVIVVAEPIR
jgi:hypothetical protein